MRSESPFHCDKMVKARNKSLESSIAKGGNKENTAQPEIFIKTNQKGALKQLQCRETVQCIAVPYLPSQTGTQSILIIKT